MDYDGVTWGVTGEWGCPPGTGATKQFFVTFDTAFSLLLIQNPEVSYYLKFLLKIFTTQPANIQFFEQKI